MSRPCDVWRCARTRAGATCQWGGRGRGPRRCLLAVALLLQPPAARGSCRLTELALRCRSRPVDLVPLFDPNVFSYIATLDWSMDAFSVDVRADEGCEVDQVPNQAIPVQVGGTRQVTVYVKTQGTVGGQPYALNINRLLGSETEVELLSVDGAELSPGFNPMVRSYQAAVGLSQDLLVMRYILRDSGQSVQIVADSPGDNSHRRLEAQSRHLLATGEMQYQERSKVFFLNAGDSRKVTLTIESADPTQADRGDYSIVATRAGCNPAKPNFDPLSRQCVVNCPTAYYPNSKTKRCSACNTNCEVCTSLIECQLCIADTITSTYALQPDGSCLEVANTILSRYWWWCIGLAGFVMVLCCICCMTLAQALIGRRRHHEFDAYDSDSDEDSDGLGTAGYRKGGGWR